MSAFDFSRNTHITAWQFVLKAKVVEAMQSKAIFELISKLADFPAQYVLEP